MINQRRKNSIVPTRPQADAWATMMGGNKMKRYFIIIASIYISLVVSSGEVLAQNEKAVQDVFSGRQNNCDSLKRICTQAIPILYNDGQMDSMMALVDIWDDQCNGDEYPLNHIRLLKAIYTHRLDDVSLAKEELRAMRWHWSDVGFDYDQSPYVSKDRDYIIFDSMLARFAEELLTRSDLSPEEKFICQAYFGDSTLSFKDLNSETYNNTRLQNAYVHLSREFAEPNIKFSGGIWVPVGPRSSLGIHPKFGIAFGMDFYRSAFYLAWNGCFSNTGDPFVVHNNGQMETVEKFKINTFEGQFLYKFWRTYPHELQVTFVAGGQWLGVNEGNIFSIIGALGFAYRQYGFGYGHGRYPIAYWGVESRIEFSRMNTDGGSNLSGAGISLNLSLGWGGD
jgi:hypothetical protein